MQSRVCITFKISPNSLCNYVTKEKVPYCFNLVGLIKRTCRGLDDLKTLCTLYCLLVRSFFSGVVAVYKKKYR